jgi:hypothetical protein
MPEMNSGCTGDIGEQRHLNRPSRCLNPHRQEQTSERQFLHWAVRFKIANS